MAEYRILYTLSSQDEIRPRYIVITASNAKEAVERFRQLSGLTEDVVFDCPCGNQYCQVIISKVEEVKPHATI